MQTSKISKFIKGWFVGNFKPTLYKTNDVEVAYKHYYVGDTEAGHYHKLATEITLVTKGIITINHRCFYTGDIIVMNPKDKMTHFSVLEDAETVVVKIPGANNDKYEVK